MLRSLFSCVLLFACLAAPLSSQTDPWNRYRSEQGNFSALMPGTPSDTPNGDQKVRVSHTIQTLSEGVVYTVVYVFNKDEQPVDEATFKVYRDSFLESLAQCELAKETAPVPAMDNFVGHWYRMNCIMSGHKISFVGNLYWGKHYAYAVLTMFATDSSEPQGSKKFLESFTVLDGGK